MTPLARPSGVGLLNDLYQLTMACGYLRAGKAAHRAVFHLFFRRAPFGGGFAVANGMESVAELVEALRFAPEDLEYLAGLLGSDGGPLFDGEFLDLLGRLELECDVDAVPEGTVVFAHEPLLRVEGPLLHCQLLETPLLNLVNFSTLIATKAARICHLAARGQPVFEFGLRRAQGIDGALTASRSAYLGGCAGTSHLLAGQRFGIPVMGTHAHSWVMSFESEREALAAWGRVMPNNATLLVDTYDSEQGLREAVAVGRELQRAGHRFAGVRLDSGDLVALSRRARELLDEAGLADARVVASGDLDEHEIERLRALGASIDAWGVGTRLVTGHDHPALEGVYKLSAIRGEDGGWRYRAKRSDDPAKSTLPGRLQIVRFTDEQGLAGDLIYDLDLGFAGEQRAVETTTLLRPLLRRGARVGESTSLVQARDLAAAQLERLPPTVRALRAAEPYPVAVEARLAALQARLLAAGGRSHG